MGKSRAAGNRALGWTLWAILGALASGCGDTYTVDFRDIDLEVPGDLPERLSAFRSGKEPWHGDPRQVADLALRYKLKDGVPWIADAYRAALYTVKESPEWGTYVVRGYVYPSGALMRYRVKVRAYREIWYPVQISHYKTHYLDLDDDYHPDH